MKPSISQIDAYQHTFDYFNECIFVNTLPQCLLNFSRLGRKSIAFYIDRFWVNEAENKIDEISLNPNFLYRSIDEITSSLVHEMCHLWQFKFGKPSRRGYHNKEWAAKMIDIGLMPIGKDGKTTGQSMSHKIIANGLFDVSFKEMPDEFKLPWRVLTEESDSEETKKKKVSGVRIKYSCPVCNINVWGKSGLSIACATCKEIFIET